MRMVSTLAIIGLVTAVSPVLAQSGAPANGEGRYVLEKADDGYLRVDRETGATSHCRLTGTSWTCQSVADDRSAFESEITRLIREKAALERRVSELEDQVAGVQPPHTGTEAETGSENKKQRAEGPKQDEDSALRLPSEEDIDQMMTMFGGMMKHFMDMMQSMKEDFEEDKT